MKSLLALIIVAVLFLSCNGQKEPLSPETKALLKEIDESLALTKGLSADEKAQALIFQSFENPPEESAKEDKLSTRLNVAFATNKLYNSAAGKNVEIYHRSYNEKLVGNTWRIKPGDFLQVDVDNKLGKRKNKEDCKPFEPHHHGNDIDPMRFNTTNLHVHGFHVSPEGHSDNVFVEITEGCQFKNRYELPKDHAPGTFWYHGHVHGSTAIQVASGMAGAIIIEGGLDTIPEIKAMEEQIMVFQQMPFLKNEKGQGYAVPFKSGENFGNRTWKANARENGWRTTINGQSIPVITMAPGEVQRWRMIHAGVRETINIKVYDRGDKGQDTDKLEPQSLHAIAEDGIAYGYRAKVNSMLIQPGYRADFLFKAPDKSEDTLFVMDAQSEILGNLTASGEKEPPRLLAMVVLKKWTEEVATRLPSQNALKHLAPYPSLVNETTTEAREDMEFNIDISVRPPLFQIDDKPFDPNNIRKLRLNAIQDWRLSSGRGAHPFHIHVNHFQIVDKYVKTCVREDKEGNCTQKEWVHVKPDPVWKDTYFVRSDERTIIRTTYKNFTGKFVIHCHILDHEDQGMMQSVEILPPGDQKTAQLSYDADITVCAPEEKPLKVAPPD